LEVALLTRLRGGPITEIGATWPGSLRGGELQLKEFNSDIKEDGTPWQVFLLARPPDLAREYQSNIILSV
jgi:hypothetical protein